MARDVGIADRLRAEHLKVVEVDGWRTRGAESFDPRGSVDHHTAGARSGNAPSLRICINGRGDLPGPLCHVLIGRDNTCYVLASGRANHAGKGGWRGLTGNSSVFGIERENVGTPAEPWTAEQTAIAARAHAALIRGVKSPMAELVCEHKEWAPMRKSDAHTITGDQMRHMVRLYLDHTPPAPQPTPTPAPGGPVTIYIPTDEAGNTHDANDKPIGVQIVVQGNSWTWLTAQGEHDVLVAAGAAVHKAKPLAMMFIQNQLAERRDR